MTPVEVRQLAIAVGEGRASGLPAEQLARAQVALAGCAPDTMARCIQAMDVDGLVASLEADIEAGGEDEFHFGLTSAEDFLLAISVLSPGDLPIAVKRLEALCRLIPLTWESIREWIEQRIAEAGPQPALQLWKAVQVRFTQAPWRSLWDTVAAARERFTETLEALLDQVALKAPAKVMGGPARPWALEASPSPMTARAFIVDADYPEGYEVTRQISQGGDIWELEHSGQEVCLVVVDSIGPLVGARLAEVLAEVGQRSDASISWRFFTRPK
ncbi:MAG: hypothetical protein KC549_03470 [Myxococcales bacterium]|nr:hypothetical protein [Myxococcales bacterium]